LVIPIGDSLLYVEPLYIQSTGNSLPELKKIIVATADKLAWGDTFEQALSQLIGFTAPPDPERPPVGDGENQGLSALVQALEDTFAQAQIASQSGNWAEYGRLIEELERIIGQLVNLAP
jgi:uncharacterized membrane protein (UPF0182 family)